MLVGNLQSRSISEAVVRTFDGKHPCSLCKVVAEGKKSEKKSESNSPTKKLDGLRQTCAVAITPPATFPRIPPHATGHEALAHAPPTPPPRSA